MWTTRSYADILLDAIHKEGEKKYREAALLYNEAARRLLFESMLPITNSQVARLVEAKHVCFNASRGV